MTKANKTGAEQAVRALRDFLSSYFLQHRIPWMHDLLGTEFDQGRAHALTGLALIPELRTALDTIDKELGPSLEAFHERFKRGDRS